MITAKRRIDMLHKVRMDIGERISEIAQQAMDEAKVEIMSRDTITEVPIPGMVDDIQWFHISTEWDCPDSPFGWCMYHIILDRAHDDCVFCHKPQERK